MSSVAHEARLPVIESPPPSWWDAIVATFLGALIASLALVVPLLVATEVGLVGRPDGNAIRDWPYPDSGWTST